MQTTTWNEEMQLQKEGDGLGGSSAAEHFLNTGMALGAKGLKNPSKHEEIGFPCKWSGRRSQSREEIPEFET